MPETAKKYITHQEIFNGFLSSGDFSKGLQSFTGRDDTGVDRRLLQIVVYTYQYANKFDSASNLIMLQIAHEPNMSNFYEMF